MSDPLRTTSAQEQTLHELTGAPFNAHWTVQHGSSILRTWDACEESALVAPDGTVEFRTDLRCNERGGVFGGAAALPDREPVSQ